MTSTGRNSLTPLTTFLIVYYHDLISTILYSIFSLAPVQYHIVSKTAILV